MEYESNIPLPVNSLSELLTIVGIPAYNAEKTIARIIIEAQKYCQIVVVCDDGSTDYTKDIAEHLGAHVIVHKRNLGYGAALHSLFNQAIKLNADILVTIDADGQHNPSEIPRLIDKMKLDQGDVILGSRFIEKNGTSEMPAYRQFGIKLITLLNNRSTKNGVTDAQSGFRAYNKNAINHLIDISENGMSASIELLQLSKKHNLKISEVAITCKYSSSTKEETSSKHPIFHGLGLTTTIIKLIVEDKPIRMLGIPGIISIALGTFFGVWMMNLYAIEHRIVTNVALASIAFILIGFFLISTSLTLFAINRLSIKSTRQ